jgi:hypothetical protein
LWLNKLVDCLFVGDCLGNYNANYIRLTDLNKDKENPLCLIVVIMAPKKVAKGAPKRGEKINPTDTRPKIVVETVNSPDVSVEDVPFDTVEAPQAAATTATTTTARVEGADEEVPVRFNPMQIHTRAETTAARRFAEEAGLRGSESAVPNLFGGQTESETAV